MRDKQTIKPSWLKFAKLAPSIGIFASVILGDAIAHHVSVSGPSASAGPINTVSPDTIGKGKWSVGVRTQLINYDSFSDTELENFALTGFEEVHNTDAAYIASFALEYGVADDLSVGLITPYVLRYGIREGELENGIPEAHVLGDVRGFGDLTLTAKYRVLNHDKNLFNLALLAGLQIPTGETNEIADDGSRFEAEFQPGSGSWNPIFGVAAGRPVGPISVNGNISYTLATDGAQNTNLGDNLAYNLGVSYRIGKGAHTHDDGVFERHQALDLVLELNGEWQERERIGAALDENSGGTQLFIAPGLRYVSAQGWNSHVSVGFPIQEDLNGIQNDTDVRVTFGVGASF